MTNYNWSGTYNPDEHNVEARAVVDPTDTRDLSDEQKNRVGQGLLRRSAAGAASL